MAVEIPIWVDTMISGQDLTGKEFRFVKYDAAGKGILAGAGDNAVGVLQEGYPLDSPSSVMKMGVSKVIYGAEVTAGQNLASDAEGRAVPAAGNACVLAIARESGSVGEIHSVDLATRANIGVVGIGSTLSIPIKLSKLAAGDVVTALVPGIAGRIVKASFVVTDPVTTAGKLATLSFKIGAVAVTGGEIALTSANCGTLGAVVAGTPITANNVFDSDDAISVVASSVTAFVEGEGVLVVTLQ